MLAEEDTAFDCFPPCSHEPTEENFPEVVLLAALCLTKYQGCKEKILRTKLPLPKDLVFHMQALQRWEGKRTKECYQHYGKVYFDLTKSCAQKYIKDMTIGDVTMAVDTFTLLMLKHLCSLHQNGLSEIIVTKLK